MKHEIKNKMDIIKNQKELDGYRITALGVYPSKWEIKKIEDISINVKAGGTPSTKYDNYWNGDIPWMSSGEINKRIIFETDRMITKLGYENSSTSMIPENSVLIALAGQGKTRGKVAINKIKLCTNQSLASIITNNTTHYYYLFYNLEYRYEEIRSLSSGDSGRGGLNLKIINNISIPLPPLPEQQKIASILSTWDKAIELKEKLIEEKKKQKKGLMQKLLTGEVRLPGFDEYWKEVRLGDIIKSITRKTKENNQYEVLSCTKDGIVKQSDHFNKQIASDNNIGYKILEKGQLVLSPMNLWIGGIDISDFDIGIVSPAYKVYTINYNIVGKNYFRTLLRSDYMISIYDSISQKGASVVRKNLSISDFENIIVRLPNNKDEIDKIDTILHHCTKEISLLVQELEALKLQKKGLMQLLLTGIVRVNTEN